MAASLPKFLLKESTLTRGSDASSRATSNVRSVEPSSTRMSSTAVRVPTPRNYPTISWYSARRLPSSLWHGTTTLSKRLIHAPPTSCDGTTLPVQGAGQITIRGTQESHRVLSTMLEVLSQTIEVLPVWPPVLSVGPERVTSA